MKTKTVEIKIFRKSIRLEGVRETHACNDTHENAPYLFDFGTDRFDGVMCRQ